jgi:hypothetical protein
MVTGAVALIGPGSTGAIDAAAKCHCIVWLGAEATTGEPNSDGVAAPSGRSCGATAVNGISSVSGTYAS